MVLKVPNEVVEVSNHQIKKFIESENNFQSGSRSVSLSVLVSFGEFVCFDQRIIT